MHSSRLELEELRREVEHIRSELGRLRAERRVMRRRVFACLCAVGLLWATGAGAQLVTFNGGEPALASEINANFAQLKTWLEQKVGTTASTNITATGTSSFSNITASGTSTVSGASTFNGTSTFNAAATFTGATAINAATQIRGPLSLDSNLSNVYDVWIQGRADGSITGGDNRNLALLGVDEDSGDYLVINYGAEYAAGTYVQSDLFVTGAIDIGLERIFCDNVASGGTCSCPVGKRLLGGGAYSEGNNWHVNTSWPSSTTSWQSWCEDSVGTNQNCDMAILCARL